VYGFSLVIREFVTFKFILLQYDAFCNSSEVVGKTWNDFL